MSNFDVRIDVFYVWGSPNIILEEHVHVFNKAQAEKKIYAFKAIFRVDVNSFQNPTGRWPADDFHDPQSIQRFFKTKNRLMIQILLFFTMFQQFNTEVRLVTY